MKINKPCLICENPFLATAYDVRRGRGKYCSRKCLYEARDQRIIRSCQVCFKTYLRKPSEIKKNHDKFCSISCWQKERISLPKKSRIRTATVLKCNLCSTEIIRNPYRMKNTKMHFCSSRCLFTWRGKNLRGEKAANWRGGLSKERNLAMSRQEYANWRTSVYSRDGYACQKCGHTGSGLHAHHIQYWSKAPALRYEIANGVTLCASCHRKEHRVRNKAVAISG